MSAPGRHGARQPTHAARGRRLPVTWGPWAWLAVMAIIGAVQLVRQQWFAAGLFLLAAIVMGLDLANKQTASRPAHPPGPTASVPGRSRPPLRLTILLPAAAAVSIALTVLSRHSGAMVAALVPVGAAAFALGWPGDRTDDRIASTSPGTHNADASARPGTAADRWPPALRRLAWAWAAIWIAGGLWELAQVLLVNLGIDPAAIPLSDLLEPALETRVGQGVFALGWMLAGVYLLRRGRAQW